MLSWKWWVLLISAEKKVVAWVRINGVCYALSVLSQVTATALQSHGNLRTRVGIICMGSLRFWCWLHGSFLWHHYVDSNPLALHQPFPSSPRPTWPLQVSITTLVYKTCPNKNRWNFVSETFKIGIIKWHLFFDLSNFYLVKLVSPP